MKKKNFIEEKPVDNVFESPDDISSLTREKRLVPPCRIRFIGVDLEDSRLFSLEMISSDEISQVVDLRNCLLKKKERKKICFE